jgi:hypothetical protein
MVSFTPRLLSGVSGTRSISDFEGPQSPFGHSGEENNHLPLRGFQRQFLAVLPVVYVGVLISLWFSKGILFLQDNAAPHKTAIKRQKLADLHFEVLKHRVYSRDLAPSDYYLFPNLFIKPKTYQPPLCSIHWLSYTVTNFVPLPVENSWTSWATDFSVFISFLLYSSSLFLSCLFSVSFALVFTS